MLKEQKNQQEKIAVPKKASNKALKEQQLAQKKQEKEQQLAQKKAQKEQENKSS